MPTVASIVLAPAASPAASSLPASSQTPDSDFAMLLQTMADLTQSLDQVPSAGAIPAVTPGGLKEAAAAPLAAKPPAQPETSAGPAAELIQGMPATDLALALSAAAGQPPSGAERKTPGSAPAAPAEAVNGKPGASPTAILARLPALPPRSAQTIAQGGSTLMEPIAGNLPKQVGHPDPNSGKSNGDGDSNPTEDDAASDGQVSQTIQSAPAQTVAAVASIVVSGAASAATTPDATGPGDSEATQAGAEPAGTSTLVQVAAAAVPDTSDAAAPEVTTDGPSPATTLPAAAATKFGLQIAALASEFGKARAAAAKDNADHRPQSPVANDDADSDGQPAGVQPASPDARVNRASPSNPTDDRKLSDIVAAHRSTADAGPTRSDAPTHDLTGFQQLAASGALQQAPAHGSASSGSAASANSPVLNSMPQAPVPLAGVPVLISGKALAGDHHFDIRLDPPDLGRVEVRLKVDKDGQISSHLIADRPETLALLRRDGDGLERALQDAGFKTTGDGLQFSLRDQSGGGQPDARSVLPGASIDEDASAPRELVPRSYMQISGRIGGLDIRV